MVPEVVTLIDGRGFWREFHSNELSRASDGSVRPKALTWAAMRFKQTKDRAVFVSLAPAIGPDDGSRDKFYLPAGWNAGARRRRHVSQN